MGLFAAVFSVLYLYYFTEVHRAGTMLGVKGFLEAVLLGIPLVVLYSGTAWVSLTRYDEDLLPRLLRWTAGAAVVFAVLVTATMFVIGTRFDPGERFLVVQMSSGFGSAAGLLIGAMEVRANHLGRERARSELTAERRKHERERMEYLNHLLRHEVLNGIAIVRGTAGILIEDVDDPIATRRLRTIHDRSDEVAVFIQQVRTLLQDSTDVDPGSVDLADLIAREVESVVAGFEVGAVRTDLPEDVQVVGNELLGRVFTNLMENGIRHNDPPVTLEVTAVVGPEHVEVSVVDDGDGIDAGAMEQLFSYPTGGDHGFGLSLSRDLVQRYGGDLRLERTDETGTEFVVTIPRAAGGTRDTRSTEPDEPTATRTSVDPQGQATGS
jgi:signal transduction histidine kinase